jgi:hypothetical protein
VCEITEQLAPFDGWFGSNDSENPSASTKAWNWSTPSVILQFGGWRVQGIVDPENDAASELQSVCRI